ncbi:archaellum component FlaG (FlaF/FlaG flagellin family) [Endobacter medicaginis]|uniref:Archaellum component FlaG (FlaF/FlaG flagellin family) n=1 Tax=Endobacter medicaginis TaxID=1181271 RepID=A0A839V2U9_9PROT|nr:hypothetical protein [Endobacter medicaginis]MBB3173821.1 archaellum component FlaG (FlaF/FlaG flagellin family) [Endobacter medicaginis]MCX5475543.1 hypothetical protein [Endobacter medicaginis]NVN29886.1 hypothetical protein [Endobacter medicaginis]
MTIMAAMPVGANAPSGGGVAAPVGSSSAQATRDRQRSLHASTSVDTVTLSDAAQTAYQQLSARLATDTAIISDPGASKDARLAAYNDASMSQTRYLKTVVPAQFAATQAMMSTVSASYSETNSTVSQADNEQTSADDTADPDETTTDSTTSTGVSAGDGGTAARTSRHGHGLAGWTTTAAHAAGPPHPTARISYWDRS